MHKKVSARLLSAFTAFFLLLLCNGCQGIKSTDLSGESLNGIQLGSAYDESRAEAVFGNVFRIDKEQSDGTQCYNFFSDQYEVEISVKDQKITGMLSEGSLLKTGKVATKKGITSRSSLNDIVKAYGPNYKKIIRNNEMGEENHYDIIYTDTKNRIKLTFVFLENKTSDSDITIEEY